MRYARNYYSDGRGALVVNVRAGDRYVERPIRQFAIETVLAPVIARVLLEGLKRGWGH